MGRINQLVPITILYGDSVIAIDAASGGATNKLTIQTLALGLRSFGDYATQAQLAAKQDVLTFDDAPEEDSDNPVTSGGIYNAIGSAMSNVYTKAETDNAIVQSTANLAVANEYSGNIDNTLKTGLYYLSGATGTGIGSNGAWGMLIVVTLGARSVQIYADVWGDSVKYRRYSGNWSAWKNFTLS